jgi:hypothetical protein
VRLCCLKFHRISHLRESYQIKQAASSAAAAAREFYRNRGFIVIDY